MPKMKTRKAAAARFKVTGTGKLKRNKSGIRHNLGSKEHGRKKHLGKACLVAQVDVIPVKKMLPGI